MKSIEFMRALPGLALAAAASCAPLTFSNDAAIDFSTYRSVRVDVAASSDHSGYAEQYLADQLARSSGFAAVTTDPAAVTDLVLEVDLVVSEEIDVEVDSDGDEYIDIEYVGWARYFARTPSGARVDSGAEEDTSEGELEAVEDLLDQIEYHYLDPYRY